ncbi:hypothetical protein A6V39_00120 [Candidatus Mycoplasma haematobovis]|uniref:Uncharacterized protein n=1 Tax=Candidatus Mycoplasma haematobovis TaxID=432608 RepID=A0A1A9QEA2_9MOLU|nr:hypothetical protein [Candidatus Mycoplasma haematobovis]OAL10454.1 hypothetical protein A6V39_00120 [Candidatus Mycoplasma haematobovis]
MTITTKLVSTGLAISAIGGAGYTANYFLNQNTLGKALEAKGHTLLNFDTNKKDDKDTWNPIVLAYSKSTTKFEGTTITIPPSSSETPNQENINELKNACAKAISLTNYKNPTASVAEQFCVTPKTIEELVKKDRDVLNSTANTNNHDSNWDSKVTEYLSAEDNEKITSVSITSSEPSDKPAKREKLKAGCLGIKSKKTYEPDFHSNLAKFTKWCSNPKKQ